MEANKERGLKRFLKRLSWKAWARIGVALILGLLGLYALLVEPRWIQVNRVTLTTESTVRIVQISDIHYKGDCAFLESVIRKVNELKPDFVCFTGDLVEEKQYLSEVLQILQGINAPLLGVPGNHDYWSGADFSEVKKAFAKQGGKWLADGALTSGNIEFWGTSNEFTDPPVEESSRKKVLLCHYPVVVDHLDKGRFDLILAGHSHGGQVRVPFYGALIVPKGTGKYQKGLYRTAAGTLYVNAGLGYYMLPLRFFCRPEITMFEL